MTILKLGNTHIIENNNDDNPFHSERPECGFKQNTFTNPGDLAGV